MEQKGWHNAVIYQAYPKVSRIVMAMASGLKDHEQARTIWKKLGLQPSGSHQSTRVPWMITAMTSQYEDCPSLVPWKIWKN